MRRDDVATMGGLPRPGRALWGVILTLFAIWLAFAVGLNWGGVSENTFLLFAGNTERILHGEVWRLFTAPLIHVPRVGSILFLLLGFYFLTPTLEQHWGGARLIRFLILSALVAYGLQMLLGLVLPSSLSQKLVGEYWFSATPVLGAVSIAWALTFRGQTVRLFFVLPVSSRGLIVFVVGVSLLYLVTLEQMQCGLLAPFGGMLSGWLFGGDTPSPARRFWLKLRLAKLEREAKQDSRERKQRVARSGFKVIEGGKDDDDDRGPDGRMLN
ncbi:MAG: rhomboid family intramembrane serine protease [Myxococcales bacterium]|nr:rhomboid family intramembrane serine protease [Myxococcales bacterium]